MTPEERLREEVLGPEPRAELEALPTHLVPIVIAAHVEEALKELIAARLPDNAAAQKITGLDEKVFVPYNQLVTLARAIGLFTDDMAKLLRLIGSIRNYFAHKPKPSESDEAARKLLEQLKDLYVVLVIERTAAGHPDPRIAKQLIKELKGELDGAAELAKPLLIDLYLDIRETFAFIRYAIVALDGRIAEVDARGAMVHLVVK